MSEILRTTGEGLGISFESLKQKLSVKLTGIV